MWPEIRRKECVLEEPLEGKYSNNILDGTCNVLLIIIIALQVALCNMSLMFVCCSRNNQAAIVTTYTTVCS